VPPAPFRESCVVRLWPSLLLALVSCCPSSTPPRSTQRSDRTFSRHVRCMTCTRSLPTLQYRIFLHTCVMSFVLSVSQNRGRGVPLLTVSNHMSTMDDTAVIASLAPFSLLASPDNCRSIVQSVVHAVSLRRIRWGWCAQEICFSNPFIGLFFRLGKVLPIVRGKGFMQPVRAIKRSINRSFSRLQGMEEATQLVQQGKWFHLFPEGCLILAAH